eukprot:8507531-Pyramimonas_sp.AAC.1
MDFNLEARWTWPLASISRGSRTVTGLARSSRRSSPAATSHARRAKYGAASATCQITSATRTSPAAKSAR